MKNLFNFLIIAAAVAILFSACKENDYADLVLLNGNIITVEDTLPSAEALAIKNDTISAIGLTADVKKLVGEKTKVIDLKGKTAIPGLIESHAHFKGVGESKLLIDLSGAKNWDEIVMKVSRIADNLNDGDWIIGRGWHQEKWDPSPHPSVEGYPLHNNLSEAVPNNPVILRHASGHAVFANKVAMELAGIDTSTENPAGGVIVRDTSGIAIGVFLENAENLITKKYEEFLSGRSDDEIKKENTRAYLLASRECLKNGITTFHDAGTSFEEVDLLKELADEDTLGVRLYCMLYENNKTLRKNIQDYRIVGYGKNHLTVRAIKKYIDGALGSRGAWFMDSYADDTSSYGKNVITVDELKETAEIAYETDFQLCTHAIGDRANNVVLNVYEEFYNGTNSDSLRWRIEHAQHIALEDIARFGNLGIIAAMQGIHATSDAVFVEKRLGRERAKRGAYVWRKLIDSGAIIAAGTDAPVERIDPISNYYAMVTRKTPEGIAFFPEQKMTRMEALKAYTINGAFAAFEEEIKGSLAKGKLADITILSDDILSVEENQIPQIKILYTIVGGKVLYVR